MIPSRKSEIPLTPLFQVALRMTWLEIRPILSVVVKRSSHAFWLNVIGNYIAHIFNGISADSAEATVLSQFP